MGTGNNDKVENRMRRLLLLLSLTLSAASQAQTVLIENVRIFNGVDARLEAGHVLVRDGLIESIASRPIAAPRTGIQYTR